MSRPGEAPWAGLLVHLTVITVVFFVVSDLTIGEGGLETAAVPPEVAQRVEAMMATAAEVTMFLVVLAVAVAVAVSIGSLLMESKRYPLTTVATKRRVFTEKASSELECCNCGVTTEDGELREWARERVVLGFVVERLEGGTNEYCAPCANDVVEMALRADRARKGLPVDGTVATEGLNAGPAPDEWEAAYQEAYGDA